MFIQDMSSCTDTAERKPRLRAERYPLETTVHYRVIGEPNWLEGMTENISQSGVLFRTEALVPRGALVEMNLTLPAVISGGPPAELNWRAAVVRAVRLSATEESCRIAAKVLHYRLQRGMGSIKA